MPSALGFDVSSFGLEDHQRDRRPHIALWIAQIALAVVFGVAGAAKLALTIGELVAFAPWIADVPEPFVRMIGAAELAGAFGLVLPALTGIRPALTPLAAAALAVEMAIAAVFHVQRHADRAAMLALGLGAIAAAVAWGRLRASPIAPRRPPPIEPPPDDD